MPSGKNILVLDAGTTAIKALVFDADEKVLVRANRPVSKNFPQPGYVEQDPLEILQKARQVLSEAVPASGIEAKDISGIGLTNQRETIVAWRKDNGEPLYPAIVWEDARTKNQCANFSEEINSRVQALTGLPIDPYFSATKIRWLIDNVPAISQALVDKVLVVGTIDTWLAWNLLEGNPFITDETNAARTLLFNVKTRAWDKELLQTFNIPLEILPQVQHSQTNFGYLKKDVIGEALPLLAICGDQQASMYAAGLTPNTTKITYGTGTFIMQIIGSEFAIHNPFFTTLVSSGDQPIYAIEAKIDKGGPDVEPLLADQSKLEGFLRNLALEVDVYLRKLPVKPQEIIIDGGVTRDNLLLKIQAEVSGIPVRQHHNFDGTALGVVRMVKEFLTKNPL